MFTFKQVIKRKAKNAAPSPAPAAAPAGNGDIYKGIHPAVAAEMKELRKRADEAEDRELVEVAKKYEIIGKKPEELVPLFKSLKAAGGSAYDDVIDILDAAKIFSEIGKDKDGRKSEAWAKIEKHAKEIHEAAPTLTWYEAVEKACAMYPTLVAEYESKR